MPMNWWYHHNTAKHGKLLCTFCGYTVIQTGEERELMSSRSRLRETIIWGIIWQEEDRMVINMLDTSTIVRYCLSNKKIGTIKMIWSHCCLICNMGFSIPKKYDLYVAMGPRKNILLVYHSTSGFTSLLDGKEFIHTLCTNLPSTCHHTFGCDWQFARGIVLMKHFAFSLWSHTPSLLFKVHTRCKGFYKKNLVSSYLATISM